MRRALILFSVLMIFILVPLSIGYARNEPATPYSVHDPLDDTCKSIFTTATDNLVKNCSGLTGNSVCYANSQVKVDPIPASSSSINFSQAGDKAALSDIKNLTTLPLDTARQTWGLSVLRTQFSPNSEPLHFLVFGNTSLENTSGNLQIFKFTSGLSNSLCKTDKPGTIVIRSVGPIPATLTANGTQITFDSTIVVR